MTSSLNIGALVKHSNCFVSWVAISLSLFHTVNIYICEFEFNFKISCYRNEPSLEVTFSHIYISRLENFNIL